MWTFTVYFRGNLYGSFKIELSSHGCYSYWGTTAMLYKSCIQFIFSVSECCNEVVLFNAKLVLISADHAMMKKTCLPQKCLCLY